MRRQGILFILVGPAGSGKSTLCQRLLAEFHHRLQYAVSATTRSPRPGEVNGQSYNFMSREEFCRLRDAGEFFEWEENHGQFYGTLKSTLLDGINNGKDLLYQIDIRGALNFKRAFPLYSVLTFILPPSIEELRARLEGRGNSDPADLARRLQTARVEYQGLLKARTEQLSIDYVVVNNNIDIAYDEVRSILVSEGSRFGRIETASLEDLCRHDSGPHNSGPQNSGHQSSGHQNSGHQNSGHEKSGHHNTGGKKGEL